MMAAIQAAEGGGRVTLFEHNPSIGRKLLVTGSSRCNLTNDAVSPEAYFCEDKAWLAAFLGVFGVEEFRRALDSFASDAFGRRASAIQKQAFVPRFVQHA